MFDNFQNDSHYLLRDLLPKVKLSLRDTNIIAILLDIHSAAEIVVVVSPVKIDLILYVMVLGVF